MRRQEYLDRLLGQYEIVKELSRKGSSCILLLRHRELGEEMVVRSTARRIPIADYLKTIVFQYLPEVYDALKRKIQGLINRYETNVFPRLKLVHTEASIESICSNISRTVEDYRRTGVEVGGVFVDYMQLLTTETRNYSRHDELKDICKALKECAARTELPIIIAAQLNREVLKGGIDTITVANIGEGADIERIAHDIYLVWQIDKTQETLYKALDKMGTPELRYNALNVRSNRLYTKAELNPNDRTLKTGYIYIERMKARDGKTEGWGLLPYDGERGFIGETDKTQMAK